MKRWLPYILIIAGILIASFPLYQKIEVWREQKQLRDEYNKEAAIWQDRSKNGGGIDKDKEIPRWDDWPPTLLDIPEISLKVYVVAVEDLDVFRQRANHPPGHYPGTALPGEKGNVAIAGHDSGPAGYFKKINRLTRGDRIYLHTPLASYIYEVEQVFITHKYDWSVIEATEDATLTLTTCWAEGLDISAKRLIVRAMLIEMFIYK